MTALLPVRLDDARAARLLADFGADMDARYPGSVASEAAAHEFDPPGVFLLAVDDGRPVACAGLRPRGTDEGEVKRMWVDPSARGRGLARALLRALAGHGRAAGMRRLVLEAGTEQPEALGLYASEGWEPVPPYGQYRDDPRSRCFALPLVP